MAADDRGGTPADTLPDLIDAATSARDTVVIAGPTAAGKSALALAMAQRTPSLIINADSMQVYRDLHVLTARPGCSETARTPHALYGHVDAAIAYSVAAWLRDVAAQLSAAQAADQLAIIIGGTGLYLTAMVDGLSPVPPVPEPVRRRWRKVGAETAPGDLHGLLAVRDPIMADRLRPSDPQRVLRALEVLDATGQSLAEWQRIPGRPILQPGTWRGVVVAPERSALYARCDQRLEAMLRRGVLQEVGRLQARILAGEVAQDAPANRALGMPEFTRHLNGKASIGSALKQAQTHTRQFAKRQLSWLRGRMGDWPWYDI